MDTGIAKTRPNPGINHLPKDSSRAGLIECGGTQLRVLVFDEATGKVRYSRVFDSREFTSVDHLLNYVLAELEYIPGKFAFALPGPRTVQLDDLRRPFETVELTNLPAWPDFDLKNTCYRLNFRGLLAGDAQLQGYDAANTDPKYLRTIQKGTLGVSPGIGLAAFGTGLGVTFFGEAPELGHFATVVPRSSDGWSFWHFVRETLDTPSPSPEQLTAGCWMHLKVEWLESMGVHPKAATRSRMDELGPDRVGAAITEFADSDPFCQRIISVLGEFLGVYIGDLFDGFRQDIHLSGGVLKALDAILRYSAFQSLTVEERPGLRFSSERCQYGLYYNCDPDLALRGARRMLATKMD